MDLDRYDPFHYEWKHYEIEGSLGFRGPTCFGDDEAIEYIEEYGRLPKACEEC